MQETEEKLLLYNLCLFRIRPRDVQKIDNAIDLINLYLVDSAIGFPNTYLLDRDLSGG